MLTKLEFIQLMILYKISERIYDKRDIVSCLERDD